MTDQDKLLLVRFITRMGMYIPERNKSNIISFVYGYEIGRNGECSFTKLLIEHMENKYSIPHSSASWIGQIHFYAEKKKSSWESTFRQISLEIIGSEENGGLNQEMQDTIKTWIHSLIGRIEAQGNPWFNQWWVDEWKTVVMTKKNWFKNMWTPQEFKIIQAITKEVSNNNVFMIVPKEPLLSLSEKFRHLEKQ
ncbi:hypothetical protein [Xanthocytophaga flava]|uniref:hypothetical protein n=1 Tax=Xanthocytophaga flava TaxID=3048013 RepID=UPI0028D668BB|nr:hypothetical protein [Xanthocytophaga flavus]MDJ1467711.1 hypothetical protein [Xanthocytophaga flavus]